MWYSERDDGSPQGGILLKDAPEMIAVGQVSLVEFSSCFLKKGFPIVLHIDSNDNIFY